LKFSIQSNQQELCQQAIPGRDVAVEKPVCKALCRIVYTPRDPKQPSLTGTKNDPFSLGLRTRRCRTSGFSV
jgi:hypothetical protein